MPCLIIRMHDITIVPKTVELPLINFLVLKLDPEWQAGIEQKVYFDVEI